MKTKVWTVIGIALAAWLLLGGFFVSQDNHFGGDETQNSDARH